MRHVKMLCLATMSTALGLAWACKSRLSDAALLDEDSDQAAANAYFPAYFKDWECVPTRDDCTVPWGRTQIGSPNIRDFYQQVLGAEVPYRFVQFSRPNDDTPGGKNPVEILSRDFGRQMAETMLERKGELREFANREQCMGACKKYINEERAFYEVVAATFSVGAKQHEGGYDVAFVNVLESTSGRYEAATKDQGFRFAVSLEQPRAEGQKQEGSYEVYYPEGESAKSDTNKRIGTLAMAATRFRSLAPGRGYRAKLGILTANDGIDKFETKFISCMVTFDIPLADSTEITCERFNFPPLMLIRTNTKKPIDQLRYRKPPTEGDCFSSENVAEGGLSPVALMGAVFRTTSDSKPDVLCLRCHTSKGSKPARYGDLLCPQPQGVEVSATYTPLGNPKRPNQIAGIVRRYFYDPKPENVPKNDAGMHADLDALLSYYCDDAKITLEERGQPKVMSVRAIVKDFVGLYDNPNVLNLEKICGAGTVDASEAAANPTAISPANATPSQRVQAAVAKNGALTSADIAGRNFWDLTPGAYFEEKSGCRIDVALEFDSADLLKGTMVIKQLSGYRAGTECAEAEGHFACEVSNPATWHNELRTLLSCKADEWGGWKKSYIAVAKGTSFAVVISDQERASHGGNLWRTPLRFHLVPSATSR